MPESYDAFARRDAEQENWLERQPVCVECKEHIQDDYLYDIGGNLYCERCLNREFRKDTENYER